MSIYVNFFKKRRLKSVLTWFKLWLQAFASYGAWGMLSKLISSVSSSIKLGLILTILTGWL